MKCGICNRGGLRKTTMVHAPNAEGVLRRVRACAGCASRGLLIVPSGGATRCACGALAVKCGGCVDKARARDLSLILAPFVVRLRGLARAYPNERGEGLTQAADLLEHGEA